MNKNINLCEILKGCNGIELYSPLYGIVVLNQVFEDNFTVDVKLKTGNLQIRKFLSNGTISEEFYAECLIFPSKSQHDWSKFIKPIPVDAPMMCCLGDSSWSLRYYSHKKGNRHFVFASGYKSKDKQTTMDYIFVIPYDKFNPNDEGDPLRYNIQK